jgi:hypothetical protein
MMVGSDDRSDKMMLLLDEDEDPDFSHLRYKLGGPTGGTT